MKLEPGMAYNTKTLNKVFAVLSVGLLLTVVWVFLDDYMKEWKIVQIKAMQIKAEKLRGEISADLKNVPTEKLEQLETELESAEKSVADKAGEIEKVQEELLALQGIIYKQKMVNSQLNSDVSESQFNYEMAASKGKPIASKLKVKFEKFRKQFDESRDKVKDLSNKEKVLKNQLKNLRSEETEANKKLNALVGKIELKKKALARAEPDPIWLLRNLPFIDFLDPTLKVQQVVLEDVVDDLYFQKIPKVDRCMTCHTFIDQKGYEDQPNPFKTHPNIDLMVGAKSKHPMSRFGCTTCHGGEGHRVRSFATIAHMPSSEEQAQEWTEKYSWHEPHRVPSIMLKKGQTEAACFKCHKDTHRVPGATVLNEGLENIQKYGCYACHKIEGTYTELRKPGPSLEKISSKINKEFFKNWVWKPTGFNPDTKMPQFFENSNNSKPEFMKKNMAEVNAMAEYIWSVSESYRPFKKYTGGNAEKGKELFAKVGCIGCHNADDVDKANTVGAWKGPHLTGLGSKLNGDWLVSWLKKPSHYQANTIMPSFRLSDSEANDITAWLLSSRNKTFEKLRFEQMNEQARDEILVTYFSAFDTIDNAKIKLSKMTSRERTLELGKRSVGKYGCYSCHDIKGFDGWTPIGPNLSGIGSKPITQFGFGHQHIPHHRDAWISTHLKNPRIWDEGVQKAFKDLLRMPRFPQVTDEEINSMTVALLGKVTDFVPESGKRTLTATEALTHRGAMTIEHFNCQGCHKIDGVGGDILAAYEDDLNVGPPYLVSQGHRVKPKWFHNFLNNVEPIRPWIEIRMPSFNFSNQQVNDIVTYFTHRAKKPHFEKKQNIVWNPGEKAAAAALFESYACTSCHTQGFNNEAPQAPNLYKVSERLRPSWVEKWLRNPQAILDYTAMPNFWEGGEAQDGSILGGDPQKQIEALTKYVLELSQPQ